MYDLELVCVVPNQKDGEPKRYLERVGNEEVARTTADAMIRQMVKQNSLVGSKLMEQPHSYSVVYGDGIGQIVGYANIAEVLGE